MSRIRTLVYLSFLAFGAPAHAALTYLVNSTADAHDAAPGDAICETASGNGVCTLRAAIEEANTATGATIRLPAGTFALTLGSLTISHPTTISGAGAAKTIVSGGNLSRVLLILAAGQTRLADLTLRDGSDPSGGAIVAAATGADVFVERATLVHGSAEHGGCVMVDSLHLVDSLVSDCHANLNGGALYLYAASEVRRSTIIGGVAGQDGGGIHAVTGAGVTIVDSTISGNQAAQHGGGVYASTLAVFSSSIIGNKSLAYAGGGGIAYAGSGKITFLDTLFARNLESDGQPTPGFVESECAGYVNNDGYSVMIAGGAPHCSVSPGVTFVLDALVGALQDNGGFVPTHALLAGSPAIDAGAPAGCTDAAGLLGTDARGTRRTVGARCDVGAYERTPCGDVNGDGTLDVSDVFFLLNALFAAGPIPPGLANVNRDATTNVSDAFFLLNYLFATGPAPVCPGT
jgi:CSLREA domain-containing protein